MRRLGDLLVGPGEAGVLHDLAVAARFAVDEVERGEFGILLGFEAEVGGDDGREREAFFGVGDGGFETLGEGELAEAFVERAPAADASGDAPAQGADAGDFVEFEIERGLEVPIVGRAAAGVEAEEFLVFLAPEDGEEVAADAVAGGFGEAEHGVGGDGSVDAVAAFLEDVESGEGGERNAGADHAVLRDDRRAVLIARADFLRADGGAFAGFAQRAHLQRPLCRP